MLIEASMLAGISYVLYYNLFSKATDREKIEAAFKNTGYGFGDHLPSHIYTHDKEEFTTYGYSMPYGLIDNPKIEVILAKTLNRPVFISMKSHLKITVHKRKLETDHKYTFKKTSPWTVPIGVSLTGEVIHDFDAVPHMTIAGMTRQGKTVLLKLLFAHLASNNEGAEFYILDLKGGLEFGRYDRLAQVKGVASDVGEATILLGEISAKLRGDMRTFKERGYNNVVNTSIKTRKFIIVDEAAELDKDCQTYLSEVARIGGALGYRLIFATQYPTADTLPRQIKQNSDAKISFRLPTGVASRVAIDENGAEELTCPGRAIYRTHERIEMQVPYISDKYVEELLRGNERDSATEKASSRGTDTFTIE